MAMTPDQFQALLKATIDQGAGVGTNFTKTVHGTSYPAIDPTRPELSQEGRTVLITGGSSGIGLSIAKAFTRAGAKTVIIVGRRVEVLADAERQIEQVAQQSGKTTQVIAQQLDVTDKPAVVALWSSLVHKSIEVDVLVLNSAKRSPFGTILGLGSDEIWSQFLANVYGPLIMAEAFAKQRGDRPKSLVNLTASAIHVFEESQSVLASNSSGYGLTKSAGTLAIQRIASHSDPERLQVISFHPGMVYGDGWRAAGVAKDLLPFDDESLPANMAVWLASPEARFLHGRFIWASWDVDELRTGDIKRKIEEEPDFLKIGVRGLKGVDRDW